MQTNYSDDNYLEDILNSKWKGYYTANQGKTNLIFEIKTDNEEILGIFDFNFQNKVRGKYILTGKYDNKIGKLDFVPKEWLNKPNGYYMVGMKGFLNIEEGKYVGNIDNSGEFSLELEKYLIKK
jgi:hypothetical protein